MKKCKECQPDLECDECFIARADADLNLNDTIESIRKALSTENKFKFDALSHRERQWVAIKAWSDGLVKLGNKVAPRTKAFYN